jgi:hypothetical protein
MTSGPLLQWQHGNRSQHRGLVLACFNPLPNLNRPLAWFEFRLGYSELPKICALLGRNFAGDGLLCTDGAQPKGGPIPCPDSISGSM